MAFVSRVALSEHLPAAAILIVQKSSRSKCRHNALPIQDTKKYKNIIILICYHHKRFIMVQC